MSNTGLSKPKKIHVEYYAMLREIRGCSQEEMETQAETPEQLYDSLSQQYGFSFSQKNLRVAINEEFKAWDTLLCEGDRVVFIPPVSGG